MAMEDQQLVPGSSALIQLVPASCERQPVPCGAATARSFPSADEATEIQWLPGTTVVQLCVCAGSATLKQIAEIENMWIVFMVH